MIYFQFLGTHVVFGQDNSRSMDIITVWGLKTIACTVLVPVNLHIKLKSVLAD